MDRWISNSKNIDCISNDGIIEAPEIAPPHTCQSSPTTVAAANISEDDVMKFFAKKRRLVKLQKSFIDDEWISEQQKVNTLMLSNVTLDANKSNNAVSPMQAMAYTSLNKKESVCEPQKLQEPDASSRPSNSGTIPKVQNIFIR